MKLSAFALDYDGTIAVDGSLSTATRDAIGEVRSRGILVLLVTGRRLADLRDVAGDLACFDVVVAENGAVLEFPPTGRHAVLAHPPSRPLIDDLQRRGIRFDAGECVLEAAAADAAEILSSIRALELPLTMSFNRGRLMLLPPAVAKSTGLRQALRDLRVSVHNTVGIGDAENDHDLLDACEVGAAVEWGSAALKATADEIITGDPATAVANYIRRVSRQRRLSAAQMGRRRLLLGHELNGEPVSLAVRGRSILIAGEPGSGKSLLGGLICEQLILQGYSVCVIDPEGDYRTLAALPGVAIMGVSDPPPTARELARALRHPDVSVVIDLCKIAHQEKVEYVRALLRQLVQLRRRTGLPHKILLDEAHYFLPGSSHTSLIDPELAGYIVVTFRLSTLDPALRTVGDTVALVTRERDPVELEALVELSGRQGSPAPAIRTFRELHLDEAALLPGAEESHGEIRRFRLAPRQTAHVRHRSKYVDMPVSDAHAFVFNDTAAPGHRARTLKEFVDLLGRVPLDRLEGHARRHDFSRWMYDVFRDRPLAAYLSVLESRVGTDDARIVIDGIGQAVRGRYEEPTE
jgi:hydroxymethylpyrimidine pyrophosphatase-like HAD family hydrolase